MNSPVLRLAAPILVTSWILLAGCGTESTNSSPPAPTSAAGPAPASTLPTLSGTSEAPSAPPAPTAPAAASILPDLVVDDVGGRQKVNLTSLVPSAEPVLLWMWAPH